MKQVLKNSLDCILFTYQSINYILPIVAFAELGVNGEIMPNQEGEILGTLLWRGLTLPVLAPYEGLGAIERKTSKIAILNCLSITSHHLSFFAILIDSNPQKLKVRASELEWVNSENRTLVYSKPGMLPKVLEILDLEKLTNIAQRAISPISP